MVGRLVSGQKTGRGVLLVLHPFFFWHWLFFFFFFHSSGFGHCQINVDGQLHMEISSGIDLVSICVGKYFLELVSTLKNSVLIFSNDFRFEIHKKKTKLL